MAGDSTKSRCSRGGDWVSRDFVQSLESTDEAIHAIESLLPRGHSSISWISKGLKEVAQDDLIADLGEPELCHSVLELLNPKSVKT